MPEDGQIGSILVVDCGTVMTKALLLDRIAGEYRFVASGEAPTPRTVGGTDIIKGILHAVARISHVTGRQFFDELDDLISPQVTRQQGVDAFAATVSAGEPLQVVVTGLVDDLSISSARRAAAGTYSQVSAILGGERSANLTDEERVREIRGTRPDVVVLAGGIDGGAERPVLDSAKAATLACAMMDRGKRPTLLYAGNSQLRRQVTEIVGDEAELRVVENVRPTLEKERIWDAQQELQTLFRQRKMHQVPGVATLRAWSPVPIMPTAQAFGQLIQYLWYLGDPASGVLGIDIGGGNTTIAAVFDEQLHMTIQGGLGVAFGGGRLLEEGGSDCIACWIPEPIQEHELEAFMLLKGIHPASIPQTDLELWMEQSLACAAIRGTMEIARPGWKGTAAQVYPDLTPICDTILISGGPLTRVPRPGQAALVILNAVQPVGVSTLVLDRYGLAPALGNVAAVKPLAAVEALDAGGFTNLATVVAPVGDAADPGDTVLKMNVSYEDGGVLEVEVRRGDLEVLPLPLGQEAVLELHPAKGYDVGLGGPGRAGKRQVSGGMAGLIIDARGRPLPLPNQPAECRRQVQQWLYDVGG